jgi:hypothetical protein
MKRRLLKNKNPFQKRKREELSLSVALRFDQNETDAIGTELLKDATMDGKNMSVWRTTSG